MLGLFGSLNMANRALQTQRQGSEIAGHNLANVNTPGFSRQRVNISTSIYIPTELGPQGTGADVVAIRQIRDALLDRHLVAEISVRGALESEQRGLQFGQAALGQLIDRQATGAEGAAAASGVGGQHGIAEQLSELFNAFQSVSTNPTSSAERQVLIIKAQSLASQFNQIATRLETVRSGLNDSVASDIEQVNIALSDIASLNDQIVTAEVGRTGEANDLRDIRQRRIEELAKLVNIETAQNPNGAVDISVDGTTLVSGPNVLDTLEDFDAGGGQFLVRTTTGGTTLGITSGSIQGTITARDGELAALQAEVDTLAANLIAEVNTVHSSGFGLTGTTGEDFFSGTGADDIAVNTALAGDPSLIQASGESGSVGDNRIAVALAQLAEKKIGALNNQTFLEQYSQSVAKLGQSLNNSVSQLSNQQIVEEMLLRQRDSVSGVSLDEEMTDLIKFQRAFEANARMIVTIDEMLETVVNLGR